MAGLLARLEDETFQHETNSRCIQRRVLAWTLPFQRALDENETADFHTVVNYCR